MLEIKEQEAVCILDCFKALPDPRCTTNRLHLLGDVIVIAVCGVLANADGPLAIAKWAQLNSVWLKEHLQLPNGIPSRDTIRRVLTLLDPMSFQKCFTAWLDSLSDVPEEQKTNYKRHVAIDGKAMRRSHDKKKGLGVLFIVGAWASEQGISLGQVATEEKSNEITAIPKLLDQIDVEDTIITIDAAGCQKNIAKQIIESQGDYVLALKLNHPTLYKQVEGLFNDHLADDFARIPVSQYEEQEKGHGRVEKRSYFQLTVPNDLFGRKEWVGIKTIGAAIRVYEQDGKKKSDVRYYLSSLRRNGQLFARSVRNHWSIENTLHWSLDMTYREDESRIRERTCAQNMSWIRRITLSLIKQHPGKESYIMKRRMAGWNVDYMTQIPTGQYT
jgi:predicted transposase YbfD/YdcC